MQERLSELCPGTTEKFTSTLWAACAFDTVDAAMLNQLLDEARMCLNQQGTRDDIAVWRGALMTASVMLRFKHPEVSKKLEEEGHTYVAGMMGN